MNSYTVYASAASNTEDYQRAYAALRQRVADFVGDSTMGGNWLAVGNIAADAKDPLHEWANILLAIKRGPDNISFDRLRKLAAYSPDLCEASKQDVPKFLGAPTRISIAALREYTNESKIPEGITQALQANSNAAVYQEIKDFHAKHMAGIEAAIAQLNRDDHHPGPKEDMDALTEFRDAFAGCGETKYVNGGTGVFDPDLAAFFTKFKKEDSLLRPVIISAVSTRPGVLQRVSKNFEVGVAYLRDPDVTKACKNLADASRAWDVVAATINRALRSQGAGRSA